MASSTLVWLLPTISLNRYTRSLTAPLLVVARRGGGGYDAEAGPDDARWGENGSRRGDSNPEPLDYKSSALPIAPRRRDPGTGPGTRIGTSRRPGPGGRRLHPRGRGPGHLTTSVPCISGWMLQWNGYDPGSVGAVKLLFPAGAGSLKASPLSAVTVCAVPSSFFTVIFAPGATEVGVVKAKSLIVMVSADDPEPDPEPDPAPDEPDAAPPEDPPDEPPHALRTPRTRAHTKASTSLRIGRPDVAASDLGPRRDCFPNMAVLASDGFGSPSPAP